MTNMPLQTRLFKRNSTYYFRARIPRDLRPYLGKIEEKVFWQTWDQDKLPQASRRACLAVFAAESGGR